MLDPMKRCVLIGVTATAIFGQASTADADRAAIQDLVTKYAHALGSCNATGFADLFAPTGTFASGFRGRMTGRDRLIKLVESERQCATPPATPPAPRPGPTVALEITATGIRGVAAVTGAEYQDEYVKTPQGWRFASRSVLTAGEKAAGLNASELIAIERLAGPGLTDHYEDDAKGVSRLMTTGVRVTAANGQVSGRAYRTDGSYDDQVYEKLGPGQWRIQSSTHVPATR